MVLKVQMGSPMGIQAEEAYLVIARIRQMKRPILAFLVLLCTMGIVMFAATHQAHPTPDIVTKRRGKMIPTVQMLLSEEIGGKDHCITRFPQRTCSRTDWRRKTTLDDMVPGIEVISILLVMANSLELPVLAGLQLTVRTVVYEASCPSKTITGSQRRLNKCTVLLS